jgi:uncharacterized membrane protein (UPF0127 family)
MMEIYNITQDVVLAKDVEVAFSFGKRLKGLLGRRSLPAGRGLLIKPSIYTIDLQIEDKLRLGTDHQRGNQYEIA